MLRQLVLVFLLLNGVLLNQSLAADTDKDSPSDNPVIPPTDKTTTTVPTTTATEPTTTKGTTTTEPPTTIPTTTSAPSTKATTTVAPTPAPTPAPPAPLKPWPQNIGNWSVSNDKEICILFRGALEFVVPYTTEDNKTNTAHVDIPYNATASGSCEEIAQTLVLTWEAEKRSTETNSVTFTFVENTNVTGTVDGVSPSKFALKEVRGVVYTNETQNSSLPLTEVKFEIEGLNTYQTSSNKSFKCESEEVLKSKNGAGVQLKVAHAQVEAFRVNKDYTFGPAVECELDGAVADIVPIAVGASLAALVVIVLIAYLIGRRRSRARGYQSV